jgi:hypothetical protein
MDDLSVGQPPIDQAAEGIVTKEEVTSGRVGAEKPRGDAGSTPAIENSKLSRRSERADTWITARLFLGGNFSMTSVITEPSELMTKDNA